MTENSTELNELAARVGMALAEQGMMLATAESCTGGWVSMLITSVAGSSAWFDRGFVTYSNEAKQDMLGVQAETLETHGAVSETTAREMALGAVTNSRADVALSITGIAGPGGGTADKPVGTVCFGWAQWNACQTQTCHFRGDRTSIRAQAVAYALEGLLERIDE